MASGDIIPILGWDILPCENPMAQVSLQDGTDASGPSIERNYYAAPAAATSDLVVEGRLGVAIPAAGVTITLHVVNDTATTNNFAMRVDVDARQPGTDVLTGTVTKSYKTASVTTSAPTDRELEFTVAFTQAECRSAGANWLFVIYIRRVTDSASGDALVSAKPIVRET